MTTLTNSGILPQLLTAAYEKHVLQLTYVAPLPTERIVRIVEPYAIIDIDGTTMLKAYQLQPKTGWRLFNTALIDTVCDTRETFQPRRGMVIKTSAGEQHIAPVEARDHEQIEYEKLLQAMIVDLYVDPIEAIRLKTFRAQYGLSADEVRGIHYRIFSDALATVTADRLVSDEERKMLIELNKCLRDCGAGLIQ